MFVPQSISVSVYLYAYLYFCIHVYCFYQSLKMAITLFPLCLFLCICVHISVFLFLSISSPVCIYLYILTCFDIVTLHTGTGIVFCSHLCLTLLCFLQTYGTSECWPCTSVVASRLRNTSVTISSTNCGHQGLGSD